MELGFFSKGIYIFKCVAASVYESYKFNKDKNEFYDD
jgi:hypothetical protein